ncbi:hypothetical protein Tco_0105597 [Tanacetum coccineum]
MTSAIGKQGINVVKPTSYWAWRPKINGINHVSKNTGSCICKQFNYVDPTGQTATGKESSNLFMAGSLPKTISPMIHLSQEVILLDVKRTEYILLGMTEAKDSKVCKITRANGSSSFHGDIQAMLRRHDRQDLIQHYSLVQERFKHHPLEGHDLDLWGDLRMIFDPNEKDDIWLNQQYWELLRWTLHEYIDVHSLFLDGTSIQINMLIEKKYPLKKEILEKMINLKIEAEEDSNMAIELIKFIKSQIAEQNEDGTSTTTIPGAVTAEQKTLKKNDLKARSILMMTLPMMPHVYAYAGHSTQWSQVVHEDLNQIHEDDLDEMDLKWADCIASMKSKKVLLENCWDILLESAEILRVKRTGAEVKSSRRTVNVEKSSSKAMLVYRIGTADLIGTAWHKRSLYELCTYGLSNFESPTMLMKKVKRLEDKLISSTTQGKKERMVISDTKEYLISEDSVKQGRMEV